ncbi:MAG: cysteine desulfurase [Gammaproteobacteria bacterium]|nr:cysteine desulfurase [Gammaproteobacteria bacterium]
MNPFRDAFPLFAKRPDDVYLDNAATTQKPQSVLDALRTYYTEHNANVHRGVHALSTLATEEFERSRQAVAEFINAPKSEEVIWTRGTTEGINLVAWTYGADVLGRDDEVVISEMEHHSNIVPWQMVCERSGARLKAIKVQPNGELDQDHYESLLSPRTKIVSIAHVSNALGTVNPIKEMIAKARHVGAATVIDGAQAAPHMSIDVRDLDCDFYAFSAHKMYGPTGIGALYARERLMADASPWQGGGEMIEEVRLERTTYQKMPYRFEAGTPNIGGAIGMRAAVEYLRSLDASQVEAHEMGLLRDTSSGLLQVEGVRIVGEAAQKAPVVSFNIDGAHHSDVGVLLDNQGVAVRTGHHCAMPLMAKFGVPGTVRASFAIYNSSEDIEKLIASVEKAREILTS